MCQMIKVENRTVLYGKKKILHTLKKKSPSEKSFECCELIKALYQLLDLCCGHAIRRKNALRITYTRFNCVLSSFRKCVSAEYMHDINRRVNTTHYQKSKGLQNQRTSIETYHRKYYCTRAFSNETFPLTKYSNV